MTQIKDISITKTVAEDGDFLIMQNPVTSETYKITKADLLAGLFSGSGSGSGTGEDPYFSNVVFLCHCDGATFLDQKGKIITPAGNAAITTAQSKFGGSSGYFDGSGDYLSVPSTSGDFAFGTGDFTIECWIYPTVLGGWKVILNTGEVSPDWYLALYGTELRYYSSATIASGGSLISNSWQHVVATRESGTLRLFIDGMQVASATYSTSITARNNFTIGANAGNLPAENYTGFIDEVRITKGTARYTANFTPPTSSFPNS